MLYHINHLTNPLQANEIDQPVQIDPSEEDGMIKVNHIFILFIDTVFNSIII